MQQLQTLQAENTELRGTRRPAGKTKTPDRPTVNANIDEREWELFKDTWNRYKTMTGITDVSTIRMELRACCSPDVNKLLFEFVGAEALDTATEANLLTHIRRVAVKDTHKEVHRINFSKLTQSEGETITQFVARLKSQASLCQFKIVCNDHEPPATISYADEMIIQQLITGLRNQQHQSKVLAEAASLPTLADKIRRLQCLESTEDSTSLMRATDITLVTQQSSSAATRSTYRREQNSTPQQKKPYHTQNKHYQNQPCKGCGKSSHKGKSMARRDCPAIDQVCGYCGIVGHFRAVCRKTKQDKHRSNSNAIEELPPIPESEANALFAFSNSTPQDFRDTLNANQHP